MGHCWTSVECLRSEAVSELQSESGSSSVRSINSSFVSDSASSVIISRDSSSFVSSSIAVSSRSTTSTRMSTSSIEGEARNSVLSDECEGGISSVTSIPWSSSSDSESERKMIALSIKRDSMKFFRRSISIISASSSSSSSSYSLGLEQDDQANCFRGSKASRTSLQ